MHQHRRRHRHRARSSGGALVRLLACVLVLVLAFAAWRQHERSALQHQAVAASAPAAGPPAAAQAPIRLVIPTQPPADDPWAGTPRPPGQTVYQCASAAGQNFQTDPCPEGAVTEWSREATPDDLALIAQHQAAVVQAQHAADVARYTQMYGDASAPAAPRQPTAGEQRAANCAAARQYRDAQLGQSGLNRNFDQIRRLDDMVYDACKSG